MVDGGLGQLKCHLPISLFQATINKIAYRQTENCVFMRREKQALLSSLDETRNQKSRILIFLKLHGAISDWTMESHQLLSNNAISTLFREMSFLLWLLPFNSIRSSIHFQLMFSKNINQHVMSHSCSQYFNVFSYT